MDTSIGVKHQITNKEIHAGQSRAKRKQERGPEVPGIPEAVLNNIAVKSPVCALLDYCLSQVRVAPDYVTSFQGYHFEYTYLGFYSDQFPHRGLRATLRDDGKNWRDRVWKRCLREQKRIQGTRKLSRIGFPATQHFPPCSIWRLKRHWVYFALLFYHC